MRAKNKEGLMVPWEYVRYRLSKEWNMPPWEIDLAPYNEIVQHFKIKELESLYLKD